MDPVPCIRPCLCWPLSQKCTCVRCQGELLIINSEELFLTPDINDDETYRTLWERPVWNFLKPPQSAFLWSSYVKQCRGFHQHKQGFGCLICCHSQGFYQCQRSLHLDCQMLIPSPAFIAVISRSLLINGETHPYKTSIISIIDPYWSW